MKNSKTEKMIIDIDLVNQMIHNNIEYLTDEEYYLCDVFAKDHDIFYHNGEEYFDRICDLTGKFSSRLIEVEVENN